MSAQTTIETEWATAWLDAVADGSSTMSQRSLKRIEEQGGGISHVVKLARARGVHLLQLTDDKGNDLVAASTKPFKVLC
jgi:hypothetical protein